MVALVPLPATALNSSWNAYPNLLAYVHACCDTNPDVYVYVTQLRRMGYAI